jgi:predicted TIM-barrel fold metal-dependent hydrolase
LIDAEVPSWWQRLGLPGLIDIHTHFMPKPVMDAVWRYFDDAAAHYGTPWPVQYRGTDDERVERLRALGVRRFTALVYPHRPDMAAWLNDWARTFAAATPDCASSGTFYPERSAPDYVRAAIEAGTSVFKVHVQVGDFDPRDEQLTEVWGMLAEAGTPVVVHCGSGPLPGRHTGPGPFSTVLAAHPTLTAVVAHCGAPEYDEHLDLVERYPNVHVDTTMIGTPFMNRFAPIGPSTIARLGQLQDRVVLGTDFPNIPYEFAEQLASLESFDLGDDWLRAVCWTNGARLLGSV